MAASGGRYPRPPGTGITTGNAFRPTGESRLTAKNGPLASRLPGRLRLRDRALRGRALYDSLMAEFRGWPGVVSLEGSLTTGSILLHYDVEQVSQADMEAKVMAAIAPVLGTAEPVVSEAPAHVRAEAPAYRRALARRLNRYSKIGMMISLPLSLAALAASKRVHAGAGGLFVALMLVHMTVHRRHLLK